MVFAAAAAAAAAAADGSSAVVESNAAIFGKHVKRVGPPQNPPDKPLRPILRRHPADARQTKSITGQALNYEDLTDTDLFLEFGVNSESAVDINMAAGNGADLTSYGGSNSAVYALHTFVATLEGQVCVLKGDSLALLDDSNSYWWLVRCLKTAEVGYIPAENIENYNERLARLNKLRNVRLAAPQLPDFGKTNSSEETFNGLENMASTMVSPSILESNGKCSTKKPICERVDVVNADGSSARRTVHISDKVVAIRHSDDELDTCGETDIETGTSYDDENGNQTYKPENEIAAPSGSGDYLSLGSRAAKRLSTSASSLVKRVKANARRLIEGTFSSDSAEESCPVDATSQTVGSLRSLSDPSINAAPDNARTQKKLRDNFGLGVLIKRPKSTSGEVSAATKKLTSDEGAAVIEKSAQLKQTSDTLTKSEVNNSNSLDQKMVLKIFSGNYDLKANYKSIAVTRESTVDEVIRMAINRFRVSELLSMKQALQSLEDERTPDGTPEPIKKPLLPDHPKMNLQEIEKKYYLSVVHGDSKERALGRSDLIFDILLKLQSKVHIPGVSTGPDREFIKQLKHVNTKGQVSSINVPNESEIRFLLNRVEDDEQSSDSASIPSTKIEDIQIPGMKGDKFLIRVYYYGDDFGTGTIYSVKTLGVSVNDPVASVIQQCIQKFNLRKARRASEPSMNPAIYSLWQTTEQVSAREDPLSTKKGQPLSEAFKSPVRISFRPVKKLDSDSRIGDIVRKMIKEANVGVTSDEIAFVLSADPAGQVRTASTSNGGSVVVKVPTEAPSSIYDILVRDDGTSKLTSTEDSISLKKLREHLKATTISEQTGPPNHGDDDEGMYSILDSYATESGTPGSSSKNSSISKQPRYFLEKFPETSPPPNLSTVHGRQGNTTIP